MVGEQVFDHLKRVAMQVTDINRSYLRGDPGEIRGLRHVATIGNGEHVIEIESIMRRRVPGDGEGDGIISSIVTIVDQEESLT